MSIWEDVQTGLKRSIGTAESVRAFEALRARWPELASFADPAAVAAFLPDKQNGLAPRDRVLRALVAEANGGTARRIALALVILGQWPGLDSIFRKRRPLFRTAAEDLALEIVDHFIAQVQRIDLARVSCLAATLVMNTERQIMNARVREHARAARRAAVALDAIAAPAADDDEHGAAASAFGLPPDQSDAEDVVALRRWLLSAVGPDADLVVDAVIHHRSRLELAASLGISHAAARKRLERALGRARQALLVESRGRSQPVAAPASSN
jgi:hypothetical protein